MPEAVGPLLAAFGTGGARLTPRVRTVRYGAHTGGAPPPSPAVRVLDLGDARTDASAGKLAVLSSFEAHSEFFGDEAKYSLFTPTGSAVRSASDVTEPNTTLVCVLVHAAALACSSELQLTASRLRRSQAVSRPEAARAPLHVARRRRDRVEG